MQTEIEAKFLDINPNDLRQRLQKVGAVLVTKELLMRRRIYDYPDNRLYKIGVWIRVRDEGDKVTMSCKQTIDRTLHGTKELNIVVDDFDKACDLMQSIGLVSRAYQETKREKWLLDNCEITIDTWPWIPTFTEVEGESESQLRLVADKLGLNWSEAMYGSVEPVYQKYFDVTIDEFNSWKQITFESVPEWLEIKRKKCV
jgi:adenylate cyclase class 2